MHFQEWRKLKLQRWHGSKSVIRLMSVNTCFDFRIWLAFVNVETSARSCIFTDVLNSESAEEALIQTSRSFLSFNGLDIEKRRRRSWPPRPVPDHAFSQAISNMKVQRRHWPQQSYLNRPRWCPLELAEMFNGDSCSENEIPRVVFTLKYMRKHLWFSFLEHWSGSDLKGSGLPEDSTDKDKCQIMHFQDWKKLKLQRWHGSKPVKGRS